VVEDKYTLRITRTPAARAGASKGTRHER